MQRLKTYNEVLFNKLSKKMQELEQQVKRLRESEEQLKATQSQLVQNEKMATLGQLSAGIAHEINTPLSFIASNLTHTQTIHKPFHRPVLRPWSRSCKTTLIFLTETA